MEIALHLGSHLTDETQLRDCLLANKDLLRAQGVIVPRARSYLNMIVEAANHISSGHGAPDAFKRILDAIDAPEEARRLVFSAPGLMSKVADAIEGSNFYPNAGRRLAALRHIFAGHDVEIFLAIRNPASFVPAYLGASRVLAEGATGSDIASEDLRWSRLVGVIQSTWPEAKLTIWCDEDTPFIWHRLLRLVSGGTPEGEFARSFDWFNSVMVDGGADKLAAYLAASPPVDEAHRQRVISVFLDKFCDESKLEIDVSATGWDEMRIDVLSELYEEDTDTISTMDGVTFLQP